MPRWPTRTTTARTSKNEAEAGDQAAARVVRASNECTSDEKNMVLAIATMTGWVLQRSGGVFTNFDGNASGATHRCWMQVVGAKKAAAEAFKTTKKATKQAASQRHRGCRRGTAGAGRLRQAAAANFAAAAAGSLPRPELLALVRVKLNMRGALSSSGVMQGRARSSRSGRSACAEGCARGARSRAAATRYTPAAAAAAAAAAATTGCGGACGARFPPAAAPLVMAGRDLRTDTGEWGVSAD